VKVNDWGTSLTDPADYLQRVVAYGAFGVRDGALEPLDATGLADRVKAARSALYRHLATLDRRGRVDAGAYVYFGFARPFAEAAGIADRLDWTVPRDSLDVYEWLLPYEGTGAPPDESAPYYTPIPV